MVLRLVPAVVAFSAIVMLLSGSSASAAIFGVDDRVEVHQLRTEVGRLARATAIFVPNPFITPGAAPGTIDLDFLPLSHEIGIGLCASEPFAQQPAPAVACTGFLIAPDLLVTAGHCSLNHGTVVDERNAHCSEFSWLFDYETDVQGRTQLKGIPETKLVRCKRIVFASATYQKDDVNGGGSWGTDIALIELERPVRDREPLRLAQALVQKGDPLWMIGHPAGLPKKATLNARALTGEGGALWFRADLDIVMGNSGSPVLNRAGDVVGVAVRGIPDDFIYDEKRKCRVSNRCAEARNETCMAPETDPFPVGAHVQTTSALIPWLVQFDLLRRLPRAPRTGVE